MKTEANENSIASPEIFVCMQKCEREASSKCKSHSMTILRVQKHQSKLLTGLFRWEQRERRQDIACVMCIRNAATQNGTSLQGLAKNPVRFSHKGHHPKHCSSPGRVVYENLHNKYLNFLPKHGKIIRPAGAALLSYAKLNIRGTIELLGELGQMFSHRFTHIEPTQPWPFRKNHTGQADLPCCLG